MQMHDTVNCSASWPAARKLLMESGWSWLDLDMDPVKRPYLTADVLGGVALGREALLIHEHPHVAAQVIQVPVVVHAAEAERWFPTFRGDLRFSPDGDGVRVELVGEYEPPFGAAGEVVDALMTHRIASSSMHAMLEQVATALYAAAQFADNQAK